MIQNQIKYGFGSLYRIISYILQNTKRDSHALWKETHSMKVENVTNRKKKSGIDDIFLIEYVMPNKALLSHG